MTDARALLELAGRIEAATVISLVESCYERKTFPVSFNPLSDDQKRDVVAALRGADAIREQCAKLVEQMIGQKPQNIYGRPDVRLALSIAARAIRRGRHLTEDEKLKNIASGLDADDMVRARASLETSR